MRSHLQTQLANNGWFGEPLCDRNKYCPNIEIHRCTRVEKMIIINIVQWHR